MATRLRDSWIKERGIFMATWLRGYVAGYVATRSHYFRGSFEVAGYSAVKPCRESFRVRRVRTFPQ